MRVDNSAGKGTSGIDKFGSIFDRMNIKLGSKILNSLRIKTQRVIVVDGATHSQKDGVEGNGGFLKDGAEAFMLVFLRSAQLVMRSSLLTVLDLDEVNVTLENAEIFGLVLSGGGSVGGSWRCCRSFECICNNCKACGATASGYLQLICGLNQPCSWIKQNCS
jgi:hypothetical protein